MALGKFGTVTPGERERINGVHESMSDDTVGVRFVVTGIERVAGSRRLLALANVTVEIAGIELTLQGVQVVRDADGLSCKAPTFRHPRTGTWMPAVILPPELSAAVAREVITAFDRLPS